MPMVLILRFMIEQLKVDLPIHIILVYMLYVKAIMPDK
jgi:hypothetical protein